jgi:hypothetical protein
MARLVTTVAFVSAGAFVLCWRELSSKVSNTEGGQTNSKKSSKSETANQARQARLQKKNGDHDASQNMPFSAAFLAC